MLNAKFAYAMTQMLREVVTKRTAQRIPNVYGLKNGIGGKTGTTQNHSDGWFVGITPDLVCRNWVGGDEPSIHFDYMSQGQGASNGTSHLCHVFEKSITDKSIQINTLLLTHDSYRDYFSLTTYDFR